MECGHSPNPRVGGKDKRPPCPVSVTQGEAPHRALGLSIAYVGWAEGKKRPRPTVGETRILDRGHVQCAQAKVSHPRLTEL